MISTFNQLLMSKYNYIMEYVNDILRLMSIIITLLL